MVLAGAKLTVLNGEESGKVGVARAGGERQGS